MTESIYAWMQKTVPNIGKKITKNSDKSKTSNYKDLSEFLGPQDKEHSAIFDETFNQDDFRLLTRRWKEKNLVMN